MDFDNVFYKKFFTNKENIELAKKGKLPFAMEYIDEEFVESWNKLSDDSYDLINLIRPGELGNSDYEETLRNIKISLLTVLREFNSSYDEYLYFKNRKDKYISQLQRQYSSMYNKDKIRYNEAIERGRVHDISTGIFSPNEAWSRSIYYSLQGPELSDETIDLRNKLEYEYKTSISFIYLKLEEAYMIGFQLTNPPKKDFDEYGTIQQNTKNKNPILSGKLKGMKLLPGWNEFFNKERIGISKKINEFANHYKHQAPLNIEETYYESFLKMVNYMDELYIFLKDIIDTSELIIKIENLQNEIEGIVNPLGLTGFECD